MSNAQAAYYAYLARADRERARVFRSFGYHASADHVERRAERYAQTAGAAIFADAAPLVPLTPPDEPPA